MRKSERYISPKEARERAEYLEEQANIVAEKTREAIEKSFEIMKAANDFIPRTRSKQSE